MMKKNDPPEKSAVVPVPRAGVAAPRSHLRLFFSQSYYQLFGQWRTGYGYQSLIAGVIAVIMFGWVLSVLHRVTQGFFLSDSESLYEHFGRRKDNAPTVELEPEHGSARWPYAPQPLMLFLAYLVIVVFGFVLYLGFIYSFIATVYFHVFEEKFSQMADTVQIYGVSPTVYWGTKFLANWSVAAPFSVAMWVWQSVVPSRNVDFRDAVLAGPSNSGVFPTIFGFFSMALFPVVAGACMAGCLGLTYGNSQGHAESTRSLLTTGSLILFLLFGGIELFLGSQPVSLIGLAVDFAFNVEAPEERTCFGRNETTNEPNPPPTGMGFTGAVLHFVFGCVFPGYSATKLWTDQQMTAAVIRAAHFQPIPAARQAPGSGEPGLDARAAFWCAWNGTLRPPTEAWPEMVDADPGRTYEFVKNASAWSLGNGENAVHGGALWWLPVVLDHVAVVVNVVLWIVLFCYCAAKPVPGTLKPNQDEVDAPALEVRKLSKSYDGKEFVNSEVSFRVEKGQIFALLGHNGAGKTTLMRQITALVLPTSGDAFVHGKSAQSAPERARKRLAFCPQGNPMWKGYTLLEHLEFFVELRGGDEMEEGKNRMLVYARKLGLEDKLHTKCECLSGGQKRRMWVLCALLQSKDSLLLLDEPTSGLDPQARRDFWLLLDEVCRKENRACVFSTHNLEEADVLAEEKLILAGGRVVASGTSAAMKNEFGTGFWVTLQLDESAFGMDDATRATNGGAVVDGGATSVQERDALLFAAGFDLLLSKFLGQTGKEDYASAPSDSVRACYTQTDAPGRVLKCLVPFEHASKLPEMLKAFEEKAVLKKYKLDSRVTVAKTTLEEVFQKVGEVASPTQVDSQEREDEGLHNRSPAPEAAPERSFSFWRQVFAVFRFRLQTELVSVLLPCLLTTAIVWVFCWRTPNTANLLFVATGELPSHFFLFLTAVGAGQFALAGRLREEREKGRLAHLIIHGISRTAYMVGTVLVYLLPALFVMLVGFVAAEQALSPPWTFASAGMRGTLWVIAIVYAVDVVLCGALLSEAPATVQAVFFVLSLAVPILIFRNWPSREPELALGPAEIYSPQAKLNPFALYPRRDWVSLFSMFQPKAWTVIGRGVLPLLLPNAAAAGVYAHTMRLRNLVVYLQTYLVEQQKGPTYREIDIRKKLQKWGGSEVVDPERVKKAAAKIFKVNPETIIFDESQGKIKVPLASAALRAGMEARRVVAQPLKKETQEQVLAALLTTTTNGNRNGDDRMNNYGNDARLFFGGRLPDHLGELLDSLTPSEEVVKVWDFDAGSTGDGVEVDEGDEDDADRLAAERAHAKIRRRTLLGGIRHPSWQSGTDVVETWHWSAWIGFVGGFLLRLVLWILLLACRRTSSGGSWGWKSSGMRNDGVNKVFAHQRYAAVSKNEDVENDEDHTRPLTAEADAKHDVEAGDGRDADVLTEEARVLEGAGEIRKEKIAPQTTASPQTRQDSLTAQRLAKCFTDANGQEKRALNGVTFGVRPGECFGLLGPNGAGKSTLFTMLSGNYADTGPPTSGEIRVFGEDVLRDAHGFSKVYEKMGIVPQFDHHLFPYANAQQHMELYLALRGAGSAGGLQHRQKFALINQILRDVGLDPRNTRPVGEYSGGMMRRMSFAISLVTNPEILLLDELTAGVDIVSQRLLWKKMQNRPKGQTIVTTSHSMAEVEAVCSRVCIMVGGELQCFGTTSRIKQVHGNMCQLDLYCCFRRGDLARDVDVAGSTIINPSTSLQQKADAVSDSIARSLYGRKSRGGNKFFVLEQHAFSNARFRVVFGVDWSTLELAKLVSWCLEDPLACIDDFVIGEPTIEQIFLKFAAKQEALELAEGEDD